MVRLRNMGLVASFFCCLLIALSGCGQTAPQASASQASTPQASVASESVSQTETDTQPPPEVVFYDAKFDAAQAQELPNGEIDLSSLEEGYIAVSASDEKRLKFQVILGDMTYTYDLNSDGTPCIYPLNMGSGSYTLRLMRNISDSQYSELWSDTIEVTLLDDFQPFLRPSQLVSYTADSDCVALAQRLTQDCGDDLEKAGVVYDYIVSNIQYDYEKAETAEKGYLPDPDETLESGQGICFDYAALAAAMLRSQGIPCQLITGYVGEDALYHAWNRIYIDGQGWLTVEIKVTGQNWKRVDTTFAATGTAADTLEDDGLYTTRYTY